MDENNNNNEDFILVNDDDDDNEEKQNYEPKKKRDFRGSAISYIALALVCSLLGGIVSYAIAPKIFPGLDNSYNAENIVINPNDDLSTVEAVAEKSVSSVVGITTVQTQLVWPFNVQDVGGVGSGVVVSSDGYILTNSHVVAGGNAKELKVLFENGDQVDGQVLWNDASLDLAIVKVDMINIPVAELGDSDELNVGELAVAIGNPLGLEFERTVTAGVISGLDRAVSVEGGVVMDNLIQTDASINPGNSGGPLLNGQGQVIGINTAKAASGEGMGFAIPINQVKPIIDQVLETGTYKIVYMGIKGIGLQEYESLLGVDLAPEYGAAVLEVEPNSPAAKAGLQTGDVITEIDGWEIKDFNQLKAALYDYNQGDKAELKIIRNTKEETLEIEFSVAN